jgi:hypothetical protein
LAAAAASETPELPPVGCRNAFNPLRQVNAPARSPEDHARTAGERKGASMRCYFIKNGKIVADEDLSDISPDEAVETGRRMFEASSYDGFEIWSLTRRIYWDGRISKPKPNTKPSRRPKLIVLRLAPA